MYNSNVRCLVLNGNFIVFIIDSLINDHESKVWTDTNKKEESKTVWHVSE